MMEPTTIYCVGSPSQFASFVAEQREFPVDVLVWKAEIMPHWRAPQDTILLLSFTLEQLAIVVRQELRCTGFWLGDGLLFWLHQQSQLAALMEKTLHAKQYLLLKQLNLIQMVGAILRKDTALPSYPAHLQLEHSTFCNAQCIMCDHYVSHHRGSAHLQQDMLRYIEDLLPYVSLIVMHGNGEPLIHPQIKSFFQIYRHYQIQLSLNTNLSYLDDDIIAGLSDLCRTLHISCDGCTKATYEGIRQKLSFQTFCDHLAQVQTRLPHVPKVMEVVLMRQNIHEAADFVSFAHQYGIQKVIFTPVGVNAIIGNEQDACHLFPGTTGFYCRAAMVRGQKLGVLVVIPLALLQMEGAIESVSSGTFPTLAQSQALHEKHSYYTNTIAFHPFDQLSSQGSGDVCHGVCEYPFAKAYLNLQGTVSICCPASRNSVGRISEKHSFRDIWNGPLYQMVRKTFYAGEFPHFCTGCNFIANRSLCFCTAERKNFLNTGEDIADET